MLDAEAEGQWPHQSSPAFTSSALRTHNCSLPLPWIGSTQAAYRTSIDDESGLSRTLGSILPRRGKEVFRKPLDTSIGAAKAAGPSSNTALEGLIEFATVRVVAGNLERRPLGKRAGNELGRRRITVQRELGHCSRSRCTSPCQSAGLSSGRTSQKAPESSGGMAPARVSTVRRIFVRMLLVNEELNLDRGRQDCQTRSTRVGAFAQTRS
jgi:hypothetical protein